MCRVLAGSLTLSFLLLGAYTDPYRVYGLGFERGIDADILATHDAGAPTLRNFGLRDTTTLLVGRPR